MQLYAGAGSGTICFSSELFPLEGFMGVHDAPTARILMMECVRRAAIVSMELVMLPPEYIDEIKSVVSRITKTPYEHVWVHTTHAITTPHAPHAPMGMGGVALEISAEGKKNLDAKMALYHSAVISAVEEAAAAAAESFRPAHMGVGSAKSEISVNRDVETPFGWWIGRNPNGKTDPTVTLLWFTGEDGKPIALMMSAGIKPCAIDNSQMQENRRLVSSDIPGLACRLISEKLGVPCLFFMGAAGDQVPVEQAMYDEVLPDGTVHTVDLGVEAGLEIVDRLGQRLASGVLEAIDKVKNAQAPEIRFAETAVTWDGKGRMPMKPRKTAQFVSDRRVTVDCRIITIGDVALVGLKPEINAVTAAHLFRNSAYGCTILISMVDGGQKYMPDAAAYENITWESQSSMLMPGAAEAWAEAAVEQLRKLKQEQ